MLMKQFILAHDLGTTGNKASLYDAEGNLLGSRLSEYSTVFENTGWAEQNPEDWWQAVCNSTKQLITQTSIDKNDIACITFSGQMMGCVALDKNTRPLRSAIIWADQRSTKQEQWLGERIAPEKVYRITGHFVKSCGYVTINQIFIKTPINLFTLKTLSSQDLQVTLSLTHPTLQV
jgi:xylulokinase